MNLRPFNLLLTHDLQCAFGDLGVSAKKFTLPSFHASDEAVNGDLMVAAVRFAIQLAIDHEDRDPTEMRKLEADLIAKLSLPA